MKSVFKKSRLFIMLASLLGVVSPMAQAADLVPVQPTVAVVDEQHQAISWANLMLNGFLQHHEGASINEISFDATDTVVTLTVAVLIKTVYIRRYLQIQQMKLRMKRLVNLPKL